MHMGADFNSYRCHIALLVRLVHLRKFALQHLVNILEELSMEIVRCVSRFVSECLIHIFHPSGVCLLYDAHPMLFKHGAVYSTPGSSRAVLHSWEIPSDTSDARGVGIGSQLEHSVHLPGHSSSSTFAAFSLSARAAC